MLWLVGLSVLRFTKCSVNGKGLALGESFHPAERTSEWDVYAKDGNKVIKSHDAVNWVSRTNGTFDMILDLQYASFGYKVFFCSSMLN